MHWIWILEWRIFDTWLLVEPELVTSLSHRWPCQWDVRLVTGSDSSLARWREDGGLVTGSDSSLVQGRDNGLVAHSNFNLTQQRYSRLKTGSTLDLSWWRDSRE
jgi:hypothetical protein